MSSAKFGEKCIVSSIDPSTLDRAALLLRLLLLITWKYGYDITITSAINKSYLVLKSRPLSDPNSAMWFLQYRCGYQNDFLFDEINSGEPLIKVRLSERGQE